MQAVSRAQGTLNSSKAKIMADFAPDRKGEGEAAIAKLDAALKDFQKIIQAGDKQARFQDLTYTLTLVLSLTLHYP